MGMKVRICQTTCPKPDGFEYGFYAPYADDVMVWEHEVVLWCLARFDSPDWFILTNIIWFKHSDHAIEFKLRWV